MIGDSPGQQQVDAVARIMAERDNLRAKLSVAVEIGESIAREYRGYLPHNWSTGEMKSSNKELTPDTRTRLASIEDALKKLLEIGEA